MSVLCTRNEWMQVKLCKDTFFITICKLWEIISSNQSQYILKAVHQMSLSSLGQHSDACFMSGSVVRFNLAVRSHAFNQEPKATSLIHQQMERSCLPATARCLCHSQQQISLRVTLESHSRQTDLMRDHLVYTICYQASDNSPDEEKRCCQWGSSLAGLSEGSCFWLEFNDPQTDCFLMTLPVFRCLVLCLPCQKYCL